MSPRGPPRHRHGSLCAGAQSSQQPLCCVAAQGPPEKIAFETRPRTDPAVLATPAPVPKAGERPSRYACGDGRNRSLPPPRRMRRFASARMTVRKKEGGQPSRRPTVGRRSGTTSLPVAGGDLPLAFPSSVFGLDPLLDRGPFYFEFRPELHAPAAPCPGPPAPSRPACRAWPSLFPSPRLPCGARLRAPPPATLEFGGGLAGGLLAHLRGMMPSERTHARGPAAVEVGHCDIVAATTSRSSVSFAAP